MPQKQKAKNISSEAMNRKRIITIVIVLTLVACAILFTIGVVIGNLSVQIVREAEQVEMNRVFQQTSDAINIQMTARVEMMTATAEANL